MHRCSWLTVRVVEDDEGWVQATFIAGGQHRGGVSLGHEDWTGGMSVEIATSVRRRLEELMGNAGWAVQLSLLE